MTPSVLARMVHERSAAEDRRLALVFVIEANSGPDGQAQVTPGRVPFSVFQRHGLPEQDLCLLVSRFVNHAC